MRTPEPFPWLCGPCGAEKVFPEKIAYETSLRYEGRDYQVVVPELPALKCRECGAVLLNNESDAHLSSAFRDRLKLLQPETIREGRKRLGLNQREFAELLGVAEESVSRWETGAQMQSRVVDKIMRVYFASPEARKVLDAARTDSTVGTIVVTAESAATALAGRLRGCTFCTSFTWTSESPSGWDRSPSDCNRCRRRPPNHWSRISNGCSACGLVNDRKGSSNDSSLSFIGRVAGLVVTKIFWTPSGSPGW